MKGIINRRASKKVTSYFRDKQFRLTYAVLCVENALKHGDFRLDNRKSNMELQNKTMNARLLARKSVESKEKSERGKKNVK